MTGSSQPVPSIDVPPLEESPAGVSGELFRRAFDQAPTAAALIGLDGRYRYANQALCRLVGQSAAQLLDSRVGQWTHPGEQENERRALEQVLSGASEQIVVEKRVLYSTGATVYVREQLRLLRGSGGEPIACLALAEDITSAREHQDLLRQMSHGNSRRVDDLSLLNRIANLLSGTTDLPATFQLICHMLRDTFHASDIVIALRDRPAGPMFIVARAGSAAIEPDTARAVLDAEVVASADRVSTVIVPPGPDLAHTALVVALRAQEAVLGALQIRIDTSNQPFTPDVVSLAQTIAGAIAGAAANARLYARALGGTERLANLNIASQLINGAGLDLPALYAAIHRAVATLMPVEAFVLTLVEPGSDHVVDVYQADRGGVWPASTGPLATSFAAYMQAHAPSLLVDDFALFDPDTVQFEVYGDGEDTRSGVAASFVTADGLYGLLFAQCYPPGVYSDDDLTSLELLAAHASTAIENARRAQRARRDAVDEERTRLARDLHDSVSQSLFSASLIAERLPAMARLDRAAANDGLDSLHQLVRGALAEMRALLIELRPAALADAPLHSALALLTKAYSGRRSIPFALALDPVPQLPQPVAVALYRIVQECLNNIIKHAQARSARVSLAVDPPAAPPGQPWSGSVTIQVRDDGRGFDVDSVDRGRLGVGIMRERAASIGARLELDSRPGQGTQVEVVWRGDATGGP